MGFPHLCDPTADEPGDEQGSSRRAPSAAAEAGVARLRNIIGDDDRTAVDDSSAYPWSAICHLHVELEDERSFPATGWLAGPRTVITAGHVVRPEGAKVRRITVRPAGGGSHLVSGDLRASAGWAESPGPDTDYGAVLLRSPLPALGEATGYFGIRVLRREVLKGLEVETAGFPVDRAGLFRATGPIDQVRSRRLEYRLDTWKGQSGSPLWIWTDDGVRAVGVHVEGRVTRNDGLRIDNQVLADIRRWKEESL